MNIFDMA